MSLKIRLMTATISPGDAIGNYITSLANLLQGWGASVELYADNVNPDYNGVDPSHACSAGGDGLLWYHYSIDSDNVSRLLASKDYRVVDYHGISPPSVCGRERAVGRALQTRAGALVGRGSKRRLPDYTQ